MVAPLRIRPRQAADLSVVSRIGRKGLDAVLSKLNELEAAVIVASELRSLIGECLSSEKQGVTLARQLLQLASYCRSFNAEPKEAVESLLAGIEDYDFENGEKTDLKALAPDLIKLLDNESVKLSAKALQLGSDYANIYRTGNFITDIRPVFDDSRDRIVGAVISHTLRIQFMSSHVERDLSIALDNDDILALRDACDESLRKGEGAKSLVTDSMGLKAFIVGEETYGYG